MLAAGPEDATRQLLQELARDMDMRFGHGDGETSGVLGTVL